MSRRRKPSPTPKTPTSRPRGTPKWLLDRQDLDELARRRCLMILGVLSGDKGVSEAIQEAQMARQTYYMLEERALQGMLAALAPSPEGGPEQSPARQIAELQTKVAQLERDKRRSERLLRLTRKVVKAGPLLSSTGRPKKRPGSTTRGRGPSRASSSSPTSSPASPSPPASTPTPAGADGS